MKKQFVFFAAAAIALIGCKPQQSELSLENIRDTATIHGHLTYSIGQESDSTGYTTELQRPATGKTVYLDIPYASYSTGATGTKTFSTVVDSAGNYTLAVPVPTVGISGAALRYEEFTAEQSLYQRMENGEPVYETRMCKYSVGVVPSLPNPLKPEHVYVEAVKYDRTEIDMKDYSETAVLTGSLLLPYESKYRTGAYKPAAQCQFEITIQDGEDYAALGTGAQEFTYGVTTNEKGEFTLNLPIKNLKKGFHITDAKVTPFADATFTHYTNLAGQSEKLAGVYRLRENLYDLNADVLEITAGVACNIGARPLEFIPGYTNGITDAQAPATWKRDLAGWVFAEKVFASYQASATLKGAVALAEEKSFGVGEFVTSAQTVTLTGIGAPFYGRSFVVLTNADGTYELTIPAEQEGQQISGTSWVATLDQPTTIAFTHYASASKKMVLKQGSYNLYQKVRDAESDWNELGTQYYRFAPASAPETWSNDLAGWVIVPDYNETATVKAKLYFPVETSYAVGTYKGASVRGQLTVNYPNGAATFVAPVAADGTFQVNIPVKNSNSTLNADNIGIYIEDQTITDFKHYLASKTEVLEGKYEERERVEAENSTWNNKWTIYYQFNPNSATEWTADLLGWIIKPEGWAEQVEWTATINMPKEESFWRGSYVPLSGKKVQIQYTIGTKTFTPVLKTDADGNITCPIYLQYGLEAPTIEIVRIFEDEMVHYYNPKNSEATTIVKGKYGTPKQIPSVTTWDAPRTYYMQFTPSSSVPNWTNYIAEWYVLENKKDVATIKLYAKKAIETQSSKSHEAGWGSAANTKATIRIYNSAGDWITTVKRLVNSSDIITFQLPMGETIESGSTELQFTIELENEYDNNTTFVHYDDASSDVKRVLLGNYKDAGNIDHRSVFASSKTFELKESAKALFYEAGSGTTPTGYDWYAILNE